MKHRVTNFGREPLEVRVNPETMGGQAMVMVPPGVQLVADILRVEHNGDGPHHYSVRPAERTAPSSDLPYIEDED